MDVVFCVNALGMEGLGATLSSMLTNCSEPEVLNLWFLCSGLSPVDKSNILALLENHAFSGSVHFVDFDARKMFGHLRSLHGDWTAYGRLLIPDYIQSERALYLDADLIVDINILGLKEIDFEDKLLAAVCGSSIDWVLDRNFFIKKLAWPKETAYFNSGVVLFNLKKWRIEGMDRQWRDLSIKYANELISHDQTILNALCKGKFVHLPPFYNNPWSPGNRQPQIPGTSIIHFVGSPKPWDLLGSLLHYGYQCWKSCSSDRWQQSYGGMNVRKLKRSWEIKKSVLRLLNRRVLNR